MNTIKHIYQWFTETRIPVSHIFIVFLIVLHFQSFESFKYHTQVCVNTNARNLNQSISLTASGFVEFIKTSKFYVDKSLLLRQLLAKSQNITIKVITAPSKWGKSLNLNMIEFFCRLPIDDRGNAFPINETPAFKYFMHGIIPDTNDLLEKAPLLSMYSKFIHKYIGKYPIIYIDFAELKPAADDLQSVVNSFSSLVQSIFSKYFYVKRMWDDQHDATKSIVDKMKTKELRTIYDKLMEGSIKNHVKIAKSIYFLSKALHDYFQVKPIILHDHYDQLIHILYFDKNAKFDDDSREKIMSFFSLFMKSTYEKNHHIHLAMLTGTLMLERGSFFPNMAYYECSVFEDRKIYPFYGFINSEVSFLLRKQGLQDNSEGVQKFYGQYKVVGQSDELYSPWGVVSYINSRELKNNWPNSTSTDFVERLLMHVRLKKLIESIIGGKTFSLSKGRLKVGAQQCEAVQRLMQESAIDDEKSPLTYTNLLSLLFNVGYLTLSTASIPFELQLANKGANHELSSKIIDQYSKVIANEGLFDLITRKCVDHLHHFILSDELTSVALSNVIQQIFERIGRFPKPQAEFTDPRADNTERLMKRGGFEKPDDLVHFIFFLVTMKLQMRKDYVLIKKPQSYTLITANNANPKEATNNTEPPIDARILVIEPKYMGEKQTGAKGAAQAFRRISEYFEHKADIGIVKYVEVRVTKGSTVEFTYKMKKGGEI